ncbi:uncharacterized protein LOC131354778 [Hemibagrus wyckioides]|uniref:uncharacterized protein LOC131354778 n=1 Tax=Hemibagrus wyckioides TaxID=337641 RepID=UPI00266BB298|nr:uncharacterized protein LOC131354778 [Hemibagrus wyckioides]
MKHCILLVFLQTRNLHLGLCATVFLLICGDSTESYENVIPCQMNRTAFKGEMVILHCNGNLTSKRTIVDFGWRKDRTLLFIYSPDKNETVTNYTSSRMQVDPRNPRKLQISDIQLSDAGLYSCFPLDMQCILTIEEENSLPLGQMLQYTIFSSVTGAVAICLIIFCTVCIHRKWKKKATVDIPPHGGGMNNNQSSQYIERLNSVYGQYQI